MAFLKFLQIFAALLAFSSLASAADAHGIYVCNASGIDKDNFYTNETVYIYGDIPYASNTSILYIVNNTDSWTDQKNISAMHIMAQATIRSNSTADITITAIWDAPRVGSYDVVLDINGNKTYDTAIDYVDNLTAVGFSVSEIPEVTLNVYTAAYYPSNYEVEAGNSSMNKIIHFKMQTSAWQSTTIESISLSALGSGNDKKGVSNAVLIEDANADGAYNTTDDKIYASGKYLIDNGISTLTLSPSYVLQPNVTANFIISYIFTNNVSAGEEYQFQLMSISAKNPDGKLIKTKGMPLNSAIITIKAATTATTTTAATTTSAETATTTTTAQTATTTTTPTVGFNLDNRLMLAIILIPIIAFIIYLFWPTKEIPEKTAEAE